jgi:IS1 family transposase
VWQCEVVKERVGGLDVYDLAPNEIRSTRVQRSSASTIGYIAEARQQRLISTVYHPFQAMVIGLELGQITLRRFRHLLRRICFSLFVNND